MPTPEEIRKKIYQQFGFLAWAIDHPTLGPLLIRAAENNFDEATLRGELYQTEWWKTTAASAREWDRLKGEDPAQAQRKLEQGKAEIKLNALRMGVQLDDSALSQMAEQRIRLNWSEIELTNALAAQLQLDAAGYAKAPGDASAAAAFLDKWSREYWVPLSGESRTELVRKMVTGEISEDAVKSQMIIWAKGAHPTLAVELDSGFTTRDIFTPYIEDAARILEISPQRIDMMTDPRFSKALNITDAKGTRRPMTRSEFQTHVRGLDEFRNTAAGMQTSAELGGMILESFGKVAR